MTSASRAAVASGRCLPQAPSPGAASASPRGRPASCPAGGTAAGRRVASAPPRGRSAPRSVGRGAKSMRGSGGRARRPQWWGALGWLGPWLLAVLMNCVCGAAGTVEHTERVVEGRVGERPTGPEAEMPDAAGEPGGDGRGRTTRPAVGREWTRCMSGALPHLTAAASEHLDGSKRKRRSSRPQHVTNAASSPRAAGSERFSHIILANDVSRCATRTQLTCV